MNCKSIGHDDFCVSMSGGYFWWQCRRCGFIITEQETTMQVWEQAQPLDGWNMVKDDIPAPGTEVEILHFGNYPDSQIFDTAAVGKWGICPHAEDGGHGKRSTVTHWRLKKND